MEIRGTTLLSAVFGEPVGHSLSPAMHNAAYQALGMDRIYVAFRVAPHHLTAALKALPTLRILGVNLTVPHKEHAARFLTDKSEEAQMLGAVNCVLNRGGQLFGDNTDARGLEQDLRRLGAPGAGRSAIVIGAGGGAAATILALHRLEMERIVIANRTPSHALRLARRFKFPQLRTHDLSVLSDPGLVGEAALIVNATSIGLGSEPFPALAYDSAGADCLFYDLVYGRAATSFLAPARARGLSAADGAGMLIEQGVLAFELFNAVKPPRDVMAAAVYAALGRAPAG